MNNLISLDIMKEMWGVALSFVIALVVVKISLWLYRWANPNCSGKLPPGSMGFPVIGETVEFFKPYSFNEIHPFVKKRMFKLVFIKSAGFKNLHGGSLFRTNILGSKTIVSTDPEVNFEILKQENRCFIMSYPEALVRIFGKDNLFFKQGKDFHRYMRHIALQLLGPECLKQRFIQQIDIATSEHLKSVSFQGVVDVKDTTETKSKLIESFRDFSFDLVRSPFDPSFWNALYNGLMARRNVMKMLKRMFKERREEATSDDSKYGDFMETMIYEVEKEGDTVNEERSVELILSLLIASYETTSTMTALTVKFIAENPKVLMELKREHETILQNRADKESGVTWKEYRSMMNFTHMVINESLRLGSLSPAMFRKAVNDVEIKGKFESLFCVIKITISLLPNDLIQNRVVVAGYTIPAGWIVLVVPSLLHYDPQIYEQPCEFNPWRWEGKELLSGSKTFMAFGGGARLCAGAEFARLQMAIFLHHLVTTYDFSLIDKSYIIRAPLLRFSKPIRITISENPLSSSHQNANLFSIVL
ncbi:putative cytochrome P450 [Arabidopsis thaliana]